jgi:hypothetical protein
MAIHIKRVRLLSPNNRYLGRFNEIEQDNKKLLTKLSEIMRSQSNGISTQRKIQPQEALIRRSLNRDSRRRELIKITLENQQLLKRLAEKQSAYSVGKWEEDY